MKTSLFAALILLVFHTFANAGVVLSVASISASEADGTVTLSIDISDTMSPASTINTADLAISIGDGGSVLGGSDPITISDLDFSAGLFGANADSLFAPANPPFGNGAVVRQVQSSTGVQLTSTPQRLATLTLSNLTVGTYPINLNALNRTEIGQSGGSILDFSASDSATTRLIVTAVPEPSGFLCLGLVGLVCAGRRRFRTHLN